jgi:hypothetical protein
VAAVGELRHVGVVIAHAGALLAQRGLLKCQHATECPRPRDERLQ